MQSIKGVKIYDIVEYYYLKKTPESFDNAIKFFKTCEGWCEKWAKLKNDKNRLQRR